MSSRRTDDPVLPLPSPQSPQRLDDKVLAYAKAHAPQHPPGDSRAWMSGLAFAGIVGVAVLITFPALQPEMHEPLVDEQTAVRASPATARVAQTDADTLENRNDIAASAVTAPIPPAVAYPESEALDRKSARDQKATTELAMDAHDSIAIELSRPPAQESFARAAAKEAFTTQRGQEKPVARKAEPPARPKVLTIDTHNPIEQAARTNNLQQAVQLSTLQECLSLLPASSATAPPDTEAPLSRERVPKETALDSSSVDHSSVDHSSIEHSSDEHSSAAEDPTPGVDPRTPDPQSYASEIVSSQPERPAIRTAEAAADACYQSLRARCPECGLPETIEEARTLNTAPVTPRPNTLVNEDAGD